MTDPQHAVPSQTPDPQSQTLDPDLFIQRWAPEGAKLGEFCVDLDMVLAGILKRCTDAVNQECTRQDASRIIMRMFSGVGR